jgi:hypothetical protein
MQFGKSLVLFQESKRGQVGLCEIESETHFLLSYK